MELSLKWKSFVGGSNPPQQQEEKSSILTVDRALTGDISLLSCHTDISPKYRLISAMITRCRSGNLVLFAAACVVRIAHSEHCGNYLDNAEGSDAWTDTWKVPTITTPHSRLPNRPLGWKLYTSIPTQHNYIIHLNHTKPNFHFFGASNLE